ncbi:unnamed protein product [Onchocerca flexuosa]|uniref:Transmembrane protein n=1 Tax=Onchocerca flexuosa TaxID=387005 RepID=A0A183HNY1_9BILA|nr:unnamed protein product [Onchocerca flexuosa]
MEEMDKILELEQNSLTTTMATPNESTLAAEKMNVTKLTKFVPSRMAFMADLDNSEDLETKIENLKIPVMNASVSADVEEFNTSAVYKSIDPSMNASKVPESTHPSMNASEVPESTHPSMNASEANESIHLFVNILSSFFIAVLLLGFFILYIVKLSSSYM